MDTCKPVEAKIRIKPVYPVLMHSGAYEGPCRVGKKEDLAPEAEMARFRQGFEEFCGDLRSRIGPHGEVLEPVMLQWADVSAVPAAELDRCFLDYADLNYFLSLLRVRKALRQTRLLVAMEGDLPTSGVVSGIADVE